MAAVYRQCGYTLVELPKTDAATRARFILQHVAGTLARTAPDSLLTPGAAR